MFIRLLSSFHPFSSHTNPLRLQQPPACAPHRPPAPSPRSSRLPLLPGSAHRHSPSPPFPRARRRPTAPARRSLPTTQPPPDKALTCPSPARRRTKSAPRERSESRCTPERGPDPVAARGTHGSPGRRLTSVRGLQMPPSRKRLFSPRRR